MTAKAAAAAADNEQHGQQVRTSTEECVKALLVVMNCVLAVSIGGENGGLKINNTPTYPILSIHQQLCEEMVFLMSTSRLLETISLGDCTEGEYP